jgi:hypothetical protein
VASYFISPPEATEWRLDQQAFEGLLRAQWPDVDVRRDPDPEINYPFSWTFQGQRGPVEGSLDRDGQAVALDADLEDAARFAVWLRGPVPPEQPLVFYDESYSASVQLTSETDEASITGAFV